MFTDNQFMAQTARFYGHEISNSLRFDAATTPFLNFTPGSASNLRTWTWSGWLKKNTTQEFHTVFAATTELNAGNSHSYIAYYLDDLYINDYTHSGSTNNYLLITDAKFRDPSAWKHVVFALDTTQSTASNRAKLYVNGVRVTSFSTETYPAEDFDGKINSTLKHFIGNGFGSQTEGNNYSGYLADVNFIDGSQLGPSSFGELKNDIWIAKDTSGLTFGTNGFRQQYKQVGTGTASSSTIGADTSGETNHYTSNNLAAHDVMPDTPTNNWCVVNSLANDPSYPMTFSEGNLKTAQTNKYNSGLASFVITKEMGGKWYMEVSSITDGNFPVVSVTSADFLNIPSFVNSTGVQGNAYEYTGYDGGRRSPPGSGVGTLDNGGQYRHQANWGDTFNQDVLSIALDWDNKKVYFGKNGTWQDSGNPAGNANPAFSSMQFDDMVFHINDGAGADNRDSTFIFNFGQDGTFAGTQTAAGNADDNGFGDFLYDVPAGFLSLCAKNLPDPVETIDPSKGGSPQNHFNTVLYTGNGGDANSPQGITGVGFQPDFVWGKNRSAGKYHYLNDSVRGVGATSFASNDDIVEEDVGFDAFGSDGFSVSDIDSGTTNENNNKYVAWNWKLNGTGAANTDGTINTTATTVAAHGGISISTYTGDGNNNVTIGHGLSGTPELVIIKPRNYADNWVVSWGNGNGMTGLTLSDNMYLNLTTAAGGASNGRFLANDSDTVNLGANWNNINKDSSSTYVMYCFKSIDGMQKIGTYLGTGNADGPFVFTGFRPAFTILKRTDASGRSWIMQDSARSPTNPVIIEVDADAAATEYSSNASSGYNVDYVSNGFKIRTSNVNWNASGGTYIYMAFSEQPFKYANAR